MHAGVHQAECIKGASPGLFDSAAIRELYPIVAAGVDVKDFAHTRESQGGEFVRSGPSLRMTRCLLGQWAVLNFLA
jgi:hypothetical protein